MELYNRPLRLKTNKISYLIPGGALINRFLGEDESNPTASQMWIASVVQCVLDGAADSRSYLVDKDGGQCLKMLIEEKPAEYLGEEFAKKHGSNPGFLLKLLHSRDRLLAQVHPNKEKAKKYFDSPFGKTEAWYVLDTEPKACIWAGFRNGVTREYFQTLIERQDAEKILGCMYRFEIMPGDVVFIPAGLPHALGEGSLVAEIQEPTDITLRAERFRPDGSAMPEESLHSGIGMEGLLDCFDFDCGELDEIRKRIFLTPVVRQIPGGVETQLIGMPVTNCFGMKDVACDRLCQRENQRFMVLLVLGGSGWISWGKDGENRVSVKKGTELFLPHGVARYAYETECGMRVLECEPPV